MDARTHTHATHTYTYYAHACTHAYTHTTHYILHTHTYTYALPLVSMGKNNAASDGIIERAANTLIVAMVS